MPRNLRVGMIGVNPEGGWAREAHVPAVGALDGFELAAVAARSQEAARRAAERFGVPRAYGDVAALFADPAIDVVTIAATLPAHRALVLGALQAGKHVYCEYPLGLDAAESRTLAEAARAAGVCAAIGLQARANPAVVQARALLDGGAVGRVLSASMVSPTAGFGPLVDPSVAYTEDPANGVTPVTIQAAHTIDLAIALLGGLRDVSALATTQFPTIRIGDAPSQARRIADHLLVQARLASGATLAAAIAGGRPPAAQFRFTITGERGELALVGGAPRGFQSGRLRLLCHDAVQAVDEGALAALPDAAVSVAATYAALCDRINGGAATSLAGFAHAARLAQLIEDAALASASGARRPAGDWPTC